MSARRGTLVSSLPVPKGDITTRGIRYLIIAGFSLVFLVCGLITLALMGASMPFGTLIVATFAAVLPVPLYASLILWLDRHEKEPVPALVVAFFWGALVAGLIALFMNTGAALVLRTMFGPQVAAGLTPSIVAPVVEETAKGIALVLLFVLLRHEFNNVVDGIVYGGLVGLGFAMIENVQYFARAHAQGGLVGVGLLFFIRVILFGFGHPLYTAAMGAGLGYAREARTTLAKVAAPVAGYLCAIALHALWNSTAVVIGLTGVQRSPLMMLFVVMPGMALILLLPGLVTLVLLARAGWTREVKIIADQLRDEVPQGVVTARELETLTNWRARLGRLARALTSRGPAAWYALWQLYELQVDLAFRKWLASRGERLMSFQEVLTEDGYRDRIATVRGRLTALGVETG